MSQPMVIVVQSELGKSPKVESWLVVSKCFFSYPWMITWSPMTDRYVYFTGGSNNHQSGWISYCHQCQCLRTSKDRRRVSKIGHHPTPCFVQIWVALKKKTSFKISSPPQSCPTNIPVITRHGLQTDTTYHTHTHIYTSVSIYIHTYIYTHIGVYIYIYIL